MAGFQSDYLIEESPIITLDDLRIIGIAAGACAVALALVGVGLAWIVKRVRPWWWRRQEQE